MIKRQLCRTLCRVLAFKPQPVFKFPAFPTYNFSTVPGKKILDEWDLPKARSVELADALAGSSTCRMHAELLKENIHQMTDKHLAFSIYTIYDNEIELDDHFYGTILPIVKEFLKNMTGEHNDAFAKIIQYMGWMQVQDEGLWRLVEQKLLTEKLYRYVPLRELCKIIDAVATAQQGTEELFNTFERVLIKQRLNLEPNDVIYARDGFEARKVGSQLLFQVFEDPLKGLPEGQASEEQMKLNSSENVDARKF